MWLDKEVVADDAVDDVEPLYFTCPEGYAILPHHPFSDAHMHFQFKFAVTVPPSSNIDVFVDDVGFMANMDKKGGLADINVTTGGETWKQEDVPEQPITSVSAQ